MYTGEKNTNFEQELRNAALQHSRVSITTKNGLKSRLITLMGDHFTYNGVKLRKRDLLNEDVTAPFVVIPFTEIDRVNVA